MNSPSNSPDLFRKNSNQNLIIVHNMVSSQCLAAKLWAAEQAFFHNKEYFGKTQIVNLKSNSTQIGNNASRVSPSLCRTIKDLKPEYIVIYGGDGTNHAVIQSLMILESFFTESNLKFPILILRGGGTGNDFLRNYSKLSLDQLAEGMRRQAILQVDLGKLSFPESPEKAVFFLNGANVGYAGWVSAYMAKPELIGSWQRSYAWATLKALRACRPKDYLITLTPPFGNKKSFSASLANLAMMNGKYFGNGIRIAPEAHVNDGILQCASIKLPHFFSLPLELFRLFTGGIQNSSVIQYQCFKQLEVSWESKEVLPIDIDGESYQASQLTVDVLPSHLRILAELQE